MVVAKKVKKVKPVEAKTRDESQDGVEAAPQQETSPSRSVEGTGTEPKKKQPSERKLKRQAMLHERLEKNLNKMKVRQQQAEASGIKDEKGNPVLPDRHDPRHTTGTFWRDRKDAKRRTLFMGNLPLGYGQPQIRELASSALSAATGDTENSDPVEDIDIIGKKKATGGPPPRCVNAYVTFKTLEAAQHVCKQLDQHQLRTDVAPGRPGSSLHTLRVNFSADKTQRSVAIAKRPENQAPMGNPVTYL